MAAMPKGSSSSSHVPIITVELGRERSCSGPVPTGRIRPRPGFGGGTWGTALVEARRQQEAGRSSKPCRPSRVRREADAKETSETGDLDTSNACRRCGTPFTPDSVFCRRCGHQRTSACSSLKTQQEQAAAEGAQRALSAGPCSPVREMREMREEKEGFGGGGSGSPPPPMTPRRVSRPKMRAVAVIGPNGRPPSLVERSEAWQAQRKEKLQALRDKCEAEMGCFSPQLFKPVRSPRWMAGPEGGGSLHDRGMRQIARRVLEKRQHEQALLEQELQECPFAPKLRNWSPDSRATSASPSPQKPVQQVVSELASEQRPCPKGQVTMSRAQRFYERQHAWLQAREDEKRELRKEHIFRALQEEAEARKRACSPYPEEKKVRGPPRSIYDRQIAWMRQREVGLEAQREAQFEAATCRESLNSTTPRKRPSSAPATPRGQSPAKATGEAILEKLRNARYLERSDRLPRDHSPQRGKGLWSTSFARSGMAFRGTWHNRVVAEDLGLDETADFGHPGGEEVLQK